MTDNKFEQMWRDALKDASQTPPAAVWKNIDHHLDSSSSIESLIAAKLIDAEEEVPAIVWENVNNALEGSFEETIASQINQAEIAPPAIVWDNIAAKLDEEDNPKPIIFFWGSRWVAAGIAAILLIIFSIPLLTEWSPQKPSELTEGTVIENKKESNESQNLATETPSVSESNEITSSESIVSNKFSSTLSQNELNNKTVAVTSVKENTAEATTLDRLISRAQNNLEKLNAKAFSPYGNRFTFERKRLPMPLLDEEEENERNSKSWLGFMSGLAPFDPNISITNFESQALSSAGNVPTNFFEYKSVVESNLAGGNQNFEIPLSKPFNNIRQGSAINLGLDYGFRMAKNFSFQTGARYTRSSSFIQSNVYSYNPNTGSVSTFLESYYLTNDKNSSSNTLISSSEDIKNAYQFLMIPVQLGYHVPLFNKMEVSVSGGMSGDFLINNILDETPRGGSKLNSANSAYKAVNFSGIAGMRINYAVNQNWDASIGANYQQALKSGVDETQTFSFKPKFFGVSYGINYKLK